MAREHIHEGGTFGERLADGIAMAIGSWRFLILQTAIVLLWCVLNTAGWFAWHWDAYPFILLNLAFSTQAAYTGPVLLLASNRQAQKDRRRDDLEASEVEGLFALQRQQMAHDGWMREQTAAQNTLLRRLDERVKRIEYKVGT